MIKVGINGFGRIGRMVFSESPHAGAISLLQNFDGKRFTHRQQPHRVGGAARVQRGPRHGFPYRAETLRKSIRHDFRHFPPLRYLILCSEGATATLVPGGRLSVIQTLPPSTESLPMVTSPSTVALA